MLRYKSLVRHLRATGRTVRRPVRMSFLHRAEHGLLLVLAVACIAARPVAYADDQPTVQCGRLTYTLSDDKNIHVFTVAAVASTPSVITGYSFDFGDGQNYSFTFGDTSNDKRTATVRHQYLKAGDFTATVQVNYVAGAQPKSTTSDRCSLALTAGQPMVGSGSTPTSLPNTGTTQPIGIFGAVAAVGLASHAALRVKRGRKDAKGSVASNK